VGEWEGGDACGGWEHRRAGGRAGGRAGEWMVVLEVAGGRAGRCVVVLVVADGQVVKALSHEFGRDAAR
jgi:hypothetical protein